MRPPFHFATVTLQPRVVPLFTHLFADLLDRAQLRSGRSEFGGGTGVIDIALLVRQSQFGGFLRFECSGFIEILRPQRGVGENRHHARLHFEETTGHVEHLLFAALRFDSNRTRLQRRQQRSMAVLDTQIAQRAVRDHHLCQPGKNRFFCTDDVAMECHGHVSCLVR